MAETKSCLFCKHFLWETGHSDYSEFTPGDPAWAGCALKKAAWDSGVFWPDLPDLRKTFGIAEKCDAYEREKE